MADLISPSEKLAYLEEQKRRMQEAVANTRPDALAEEGMALGRAGAPAVPPGPQGAPPVAPGEDQTRSFPEWQSLQRIEQEGVPRPGMTGYQPPEPGEETDYSSWMAKYAKPGGQQEYEQARPGLETVPWIRPVAGRGGLGGAPPGTVEGPGLKIAETRLEQEKLKQKGMSERIEKPKRAEAAKPRAEKIRLAVKDARDAAKVRIDAIIKGLGERGIPTTEEEWTAAFTSAPTKTRELTSIRSEAGRRRIAEEELIRILKTAYGFGDAEARKIATTEGARIHVVPGGGGGGSELGDTLNLFR